VECVRESGGEGSEEWSVGERVGGLTNIPAVHGGALLVRKKKSKVHTAQSIQRSAYSAVHTAQHIQRSAYSAVHTAQCIQRSAYSAVHTAQYIQRIPYSAVLYQCREEGAECVQLPVPTRTPRKT
jgi:hypothetical protein